MHSLVLSQCSEIPHKLSSDIQELLRSWATICTGASSCANIGPFCGTFLQVRFSQYTLKRSLIFKAELHVLPRQNRPCTNLNRGKNEEGPSIDPQWHPSQSTEQFPPPPLHQSHQGKIFQEASVHLRKCLSLAGLDMTTKRRRGRNFGLSCLTLSPLTRCSHYPINTCARSHQIFRDK